MRRLLSRLLRRAGLAFDAAAAEVSVTEVAQYGTKLEQEIATYADVENINDLPPIHDYWAHKYIIPLVQQFGFSSSETLYSSYMGF